MVSLFQVLTLTLLTVSVQCQNPTTAAALPEKCNNGPLVSCYQTVVSDIYIAGADLQAYCRAVMKYIKCIETATCDCKLGVNVAALTQSTTHNHLLTYYNCSTALNETIDVSPGFNCPGGVTPGDPEVEGLLVMSLETLESVAILENQCTGIKPCYKAYSDAAGVALYKKSLRSLCSANEDFLDCYEKAACTCGENKNTQIVNMVDTERTVYNQYCTILTNGVFFEKGIKCEGDVPVDVCEQANPIYDCFEDFQKSTFNAGTDRNTFCPAFKDYLNCSEATACKCGLTKSPYVLQELTLAHANYDYQRCNEVSGAIQIQFGINCPKSGTSENEILESLGLLENNLVLKSIQDCHSLERCYRIKDTVSAKALHEKNVTAMCQSYSDFIHCAEQASCLCGRFSDPVFQRDLYQQKLQHLGICPADITIKEVYSCDACVLSDSQNLNNPIAQCRIDYEESTKSAPKDMNLVCPGYKSFLKCVEGTACSCGLKKSVSILQSLSLAHAFYDINKCASISGEFPIKFGINCPYENTNGTSANEKLTTMGLLESEASLRYVRICPDIKQCMVNVNADMAKALHEKNGEGFCRAGSIYVHCLEDTKCGCENEDYQKFATLARTQHLTVCLDASFNQAVTCGSTVIQISSFTFLFITSYLLISLF